MRGIGILLILTGLIAIGVKALDAYNIISLAPYFDMVVDQSRALIEKFGIYADYGIRGAVVLLGVVFLMLGSGDDE